MKIKVSDLKPNPFRQLDRYPTKPEKVEALVKSIKDTSFWDNLLVRKSPDGKGYEIAYGHNRLAALKKVGTKEVDIPLRNLTDTDMARIMSHENMEEWGASADIEQETVRAIIKGYAAGRIELEKVPKNNMNRDHVRFAPAFDIGSTSGKSAYPYTIGTLTKFLGWKPYKVEAALLSLANIERGLATEEDLVGLSAKQALVVGQQVSRAFKETGDKNKARNVGKQLSAGMKSASGKKPGGTKGQVQDVTIHSARYETDVLLGKHDIPPGKKKPIPDIGRFTSFLSGDIDKLLTQKHEGGSLAEKLRRLAECADDIPSNERNGLIKSIRNHCNEMQDYATRIERRSSSSRPAIASGKKKNEHSVHA